MNAVEQLEALNPVPELRGNPGPLQQLDAPKGGRRVPLALAVAAIALLVAGIGAVLLRPSDDAGQSLEVASQEPLIHGSENGQPMVQTQATVEPIDAEANGEVVQAERAGAGVVTFAPIDQLNRGEAMARLAIPAIDLDLIVVEGVSIEDLRKGPGHYPESPFPGQAGNVAIAGLRTTYGALFFRLDELSAGDRVFATTAQGVSEYRVTENMLVDPDRLDVLEDYGDNRLTLTTDHPPYTKRQRLVVVAELVGEPVPTISVLGLPQGAAALAQIDPATAPDISDLSFWSGRQPYYSYYGSGHVLQSAWGFIGSQFPDWDYDNLSLAVHERTLRSASVRWVDTEHDTAGWIVLSYGDGQFWVFEMTMDGVEIDVSGTSDAAVGSISSAEPVLVEVLAPIALWSDPARRVPTPRNFPQDPLVRVLPKALSNGLTAFVDFTVDAEVGVDSDAFAEVRSVIRTSEGVQIGGVARSLNPEGLGGTGLTVAVADLDALEAFLEERADAVERWAVTDRFQSVEQFQFTRPDLVPRTVDGLPAYVSVRVFFNERSTQDDGLKQRELVSELFEKFHHGPAPGSSLEEPRSVAGVGPPAAGYQIDELPQVARCVGWPTRPDANLVVNQVRSEAATPDEVIRLAPLALQGHAIEFTNAAGDVLGYAKAASGRPWTFVTVIEVQQLETGMWVVDRWWNTGC